MLIKYFLLAGLALILSCTSSGNPQSPAERLARQSLKMIRFEHKAMAGEIALEGEPAAADKLFLETVRLGPACAEAWLEGGEGACGEKIEAFLAAAESLKDLAREDDPASVITSLLQQAPESAPYAVNLIEGYAAAFQLCLEVERDGTFMQELLPFLVALGCPFTFRDLGLEHAGRARMEELAGQASGMTGQMPYSTEPFDYFITMVKLDSWGSKFSGQVTADTLAARLMATGQFKDILPGLRDLEPAVIGFLGDSHMDKIHWSTQAPFPEIVAGVFRQVNPSVEVVNAGKGGDDSGEALARIEKDLLARKPDISFVMLGGNDCRHWGRPEPAVTPAKYFENMSEIVTRLRDAGSEVVLLYYPRGGELSGVDLEVFLAIREQMKALRDSLGTGWIDIAGMLDGGDVQEVFAVDKIHFNPNTHIRIAGKVLDYLSRR